MKLNANRIKVDLKLVFLSILLFLTAGCGKTLNDEAVAEGVQSDTAGLQETGYSMAVNEGLVKAEGIKKGYGTTYEVFVYSFYDSDGDGIGDLKGLTGKLDYINDGDDSTNTDLGCDGIWLMPVMPSTTYHKYDVTDYYGIDSQYGTMEDFENLIRECDARGIRVIMDLVINHSSSGHRWFQEACEYLAGLDGREPDEAECPAFGYYHFSKEVKSKYYQVPGTTDWYYEGRFWSEMPDLNLGNEGLRAEIEKITAFWLDKGVTGFRLDAAKEFYSGDDSANIEVLTWFNDMVKEQKEDIYLVAEIWSDTNTYASYYDSGIDSVFNFAFADDSGIIASVVAGNKQASGYGKAMMTLQDQFAGHNPDYIDAPFYTNHDMNRSAGYYLGKNAEKKVKMAGALNLLMSGNVFVYYGEELGMDGAGKDENKRAPMYWSKDSRTEGMCAGPLYMDNIKMEYGSYEEQIKDPYSIYNYFKEAIKIRNVFPEIIQGKVELLSEISNKTICAFTKLYDGKAITIICNMSPDTENISLAAADPEIKAVLCTDDAPVILNDHTVTLPGYGIVILSDK